MSSYLRKHFAFFAINTLILPFILQAQVETAKKPAFKNNPAVCQFGNDIFTKSEIIKIAKIQQMTQNASSILGYSNGAGEHLHQGALFFIDRTQSSKNVLTTTDVLDSVIFSSFGFKYKEIYIYDYSGKLLTTLLQKKESNTTIGMWENLTRQTYTYDDRSGKRLTEVLEQWNQNTGIWIFYTRLIFTYDSSGNMLMELDEFWDDTEGVWLSLNRNSYTYDSIGNMLANVWEIWNRDASVWVFKESDTYTYDSSGNILTKVEEVWDLTEGILWYKRRYTYTYDGSGNRLTELWEKWDQSTGAWLIYQRYTYTYDESGNVLTELSELWDAIIGMWVYYNRYRFIYDNNGNLLAEFGEFWDKNADAWLASYRSTLTYDGSGKVLSKLWENWDQGEGIWVIDFRWTYTYDSKGNVLTQLWEDWDSRTGVWGSPYRDTYNYDSRGNLIHFISEFKEWWSTSDWKSKQGICTIQNNIYSCEELFAYYSCPANVIHQSENNILDTYCLCQNFPNPFNPTTTILYFVFKPMKIKLAIYNSLGQEICILVDKEQKPGEYQASFDGSSISNGLYFYRIMSDTFVETKKMLLKR